MLIFVLFLGCLGREGADDEGGKGKRRSRQLYPGVATAPVPSGVTAPAMPAAGFASQVRLGFYDGGRTFSTTSLKVNQLGWAYLGAQLVLASDADGILYALWTAADVLVWPW
jgi:hypothetical protein